MRSSRTARGLRYFVIASGAAGLAVHQTVGAEPNVNFSLAEDAVLVADAVRLSLFALHANDPAGGGFGGHDWSVDRARDEENVTEVTRSQK